MHPPSVDDKIRACVRAPICRGTVAKGAARPLIPYWLIDRPVLPTGAGSIARVDLDRWRPHAKGRALARGGPQIASAQLHAQQHVRRIRRSLLTRRSTYILKPGYCADRCTFGAIDRTGACTGAEGSEAQSKPRAVLPCLRPPHALRSLGHGRWTAAEHCGGCACSRDGAATKMRINKCAAENDPKTAIEM